MFRAISLKSEITFFSGRDSYLSVGRAGPFLLELNYHFSVAGIPIWVLVVLGFLLAVGCIFYIRIFQPDCWPKEI
jgi:hypothetical protein